jgi:hypothetical protein
MPAPYIANLRPVRGGGGGGGGGGRRARARGAGAVGGAAPERRAGGVHAARGAAVCDVRRRRRARARGAGAGGSAAPERRAGGVHAARGAAACGARAAPGTLRGARTACCWGPPAATPAPVYACRPSSSRRWRAPRAAPGATGQAPSRAVGRSGCVRWWGCVWEVYGPSWVVGECGGGARRGPFVPRTPRRQPDPPARPPLPAAPAAAAWKAPRPRARRAPLPGRAYRPTGPGSEGFWGPGPRGSWVHWGGARGAGPQRERGTDGALGGAARAGPDPGGGKRPRRAAVLQDGCRAAGVRPRQQRGGTMCISGQRARRASIGAIRPGAGLQPPRGSRALADGGAAWPGSAGRSALQWLHSCAARSSWEALKGRRASDSSEAACAACPQQARDGQVLWGGLPQQKASACSVLSPRRSPALRRPHAV